MTDNRQMADDARIRRSAGQLVTGIALTAAGIVLLAVGLSIGAIGTGILGAAGIAAGVATGLVGLRKRLENADAAAQALVDLAGGRPTP